MTETHAHHQDFEASWWGDCSNTYTEETKQLLYANRMGLVPHRNAGQGPFFDLGGKSVVDIGGGPVSLLLKTRNRGKFMRVVDPCGYPGWVYRRYKECGIGVTQDLGENAAKQLAGLYDECWIYNVLQHVVDPALLIGNAWQLARTVRLFEWIDLPAHEGHPHELHAADLMGWLEAGGTREYCDVEDLDELECVGRAFYGVWHRKAEDEPEPQGMRSAPMVVMDEVRDWSTVEGKTLADLVTVGGPSETMEQA